MSIEKREREVDEKSTTPKLECLACGQLNDDHDADCSAMKELEGWALHDRAIRASHGAKTPRGMSGIMPVDEEEEEFSEPSDMEQDDLEHMVLPPPTMDLRWFFNLYEVDVRSQIAVCRTHANNLAAVTRAVEPKEKKAKKSKSSKK